MAKSASGKWVSRVGSSGGGKSYKKTRPSNYYGALLLIVVAGLLLAIYSRYEYQHPSTTTTAPQVAPAVGTTWYAALSIQACGQTLANLPSDLSGRGGFVVLGSNVIRVAPTSATDAGNNATVKQFASEYNGLVATTSQLQIPTATGTLNPKTAFKNGQACPSTSHYAGKKGTVVYAYWRTFGQQAPTLTTDPSTIKFSQYLRVTMAFEPAGVVPSPPAQKTVNAMVALAQTTTSTTLPVTTSSVPATSSTTTSTPRSTSSTTTTTTKG